ALWGVPEAECTALANLTAEADRIPTLAMSGERTPVITAQCREAFNALAEKMRFLKNRYFLIFASPGNLRFLYRAYKTVVNSRNVIYEV
ncbi:MAG: hypothetical protein LBS48_07040, partial [Treponema sp.]|nr:hypothetical protein [Treponema sp.]